MDLRRAIVVGSLLIIGLTTISAKPALAQPDLVLTSPNGTDPELVTLLDEGGNKDVVDVTNVTVNPNDPNPSNTLTVTGNVRLRVFGDVVNDGLIILDANTVPGGAVSPSADFQVTGSDLSLTGSGTLRMVDVDDPGLNRLESDSGNRLLTQGPNHTIEGEGRVGEVNSDLSIINQGTFDANLSGQTLQIDPRNSSDLGVITFDNSGVAQASGGGELRLQAGNYGGTGAYQALAGSSITLDAAVLINATITTAGDGVVSSFGATRLVGVTNGGDFQLIGGQDLRLSGVINNTGTLSTQTEEDGQSEFVLDDATSLTGGGTVTLQENDRFRRFSGAVTLTNVDNTIQGAGGLGGANSQLSVVNQGMIDANVDGETLLLDPRNDGDRSVITFDNQSTTQASGGGDLRLQPGNYGGAGVYQALAGSSITIDGATLIGATLSSSDDGVVTTFGATVFDDVTNNGDLRVGNSTDLRLAGTLTNNATLTTGTTPGALEEIVLEGDVSLAGGGTVTLQEDDRIRRVSGPVTLTNIDNTIQGAGSLGGVNSQLTVVNQGTIDANVSGETLDLDPRNEGDRSVLTFDNQDTAQASGGGVLELQGGNFGGTGTYQALAGSTVELNGATLIGATLSTTGDGVVTTSGAATLVDVTNNGDLRVGNTTDLRLAGTLTNNATLTTGTAPGALEEILIEGEVSLTGGGTVTLQENDRIRRVSGNVTLTNVDNTIQGAGRLGGASSLLTVVNQSLIDASVNGETLSIDPRNTGDPADVTFDNQGVARASGGGTLELLNGNYSGDGTYRALADSTINVNTTTVRNSTFDTVGNGEVLFSNSAAHNITNDGAITVPNTRDFDIHGTIINNGTINLASTGSVTELVVASDATLAGGGTVNLPTTSDRIRNEGGSTLTNADNTIQGVGVINAPIENNGAIVGDNGLFIEINARLSGDGLLANVRIDDVHAPGSSTATVPLSGDYTIASTGELHVEFGGTTAGAEYDQLDSDGAVTIDGDLVVSYLALGNSYIPAAGDTLAIITSDNAISGVFDAESLPDAAGGRNLTWAPVDYSDPLEVVLEITAATPFVLLGDSNGDGAVNTLDIDAFVLAISNPGQYAAFYAGVDFLGMNDINSDGVVNTLDIDPFVAILTGGGAIRAPEPAAAGPAILALLATAGGRRRTTTPGSQTRRERASM